jgi:hypothetical protein
MRSRKQRGSVFVRGRMRRRQHLSVCTFLYMGIVGSEKHEKKKVMQIPTHPILFPKLK